MHFRCPVHRCSGQSLGLHGCLPVVFLWVFDGSYRGQLAPVELSMDLIFLNSVHPHDVIRHQNSV
ncbi:hypothetical protein SL1157_3125 [Ruegeria lacuscaerulensis ITI-1157]|nr:hypothetical protein SL1157_3125 [Ruegeria lacuscaerulensis ITI-1157]